MDTSAKDVFDASFDEKSLGKHPKTIYLNGSKRVQSSVESRDEQKQKKLWVDSAALAALKTEEMPVALSK